MMFFQAQAPKMVTADAALPGRDEAILSSAKHFITQADLMPPFASHLQQIVFGMGCFWGAEKCFWSIDGVQLTAVGYAAGFTPNPTYQEVCSGQTGHNEVVLVVFDPKHVELKTLLAKFWQNHDPTQGMRQGNDVGTQYRSGIYCAQAHLDMVAQSQAQYQSLLAAAGKGKVTTEIKLMPTFYYAELYHQQYLAKNPSGYCGLGGTGVEFS